MFVMYLRLNDWGFALTQPWCVSWAQYAVVTPCLSSGCAAAPSACCVCQRVSGSRKPCSQCERPACAACIQECNICSDRCCSLCAVTEWVDRITLLLISFNRIDHPEITICSSSGRPRLGWVCFFIRFGEMCLCISVSAMHVNGCRQNESLIKMLDLFHLLSSPDD